MEVDPTGTIAGVDDMLLLGVAGLVNGGCYLTIFAWQNYLSMMQPPKDAKDPNGAKAPGKPGEKEGFVDPPGGEEWAKAPNGDYGWKDKDGNIWVPTGWAGAPGTGTTGPAHDGPHWDVQGKNGKFGGSIYPGGRSR